MKVLLHFFSGYAYIVFSLVLESTYNVIDKDELLAFVGLTRGADIKSPRFHSKIF